MYRDDPGGLRSLVGLRRGFWCLGAAVIASEAKQSPRARSAPDKKRGNSGAFSAFFWRAYRRALDCFASLAMTGWRFPSSHAAGSAAAPASRRRTASRSRAPAHGRRRADRGRTHRSARSRLRRRDSERPAVAARDGDLVADRHILEEAEMRVAMRRIDRDAALAGFGVGSTWPGPNASAWPLEPASAIARAPSRVTSMRATGQVSAQDQGLGAAGRDGLGKGALEQHLREQRLGVDVGALAEQQRAGEARRRARAGHGTPSLRACDARSRERAASQCRRRRASALLAERGRRA